MKTRHFLLFMACIGLMAACSKENISTVPEKEKISEACELLGFGFSKADNPAILSTSAGIFGTDNTVYVTVAGDCDLSNLIPYFKVSKAATLQIDGRPSGPDKQSYDFSNTVNLKVTAESGRTASYTLLVQKGNKSIDEAIYTFMSLYSIPGMSFAYTKDESLHYAQAYGFAILNSKTRTLPTHLFRLASVSKQFTTLCIMTLMEEGKLSLDRTIFGAGGILEKEYPHVTGKPTQVTVRHCLEHTTGWVSNPDPMFNGSFHGMTLEERIDYMLKSPQSDPGTVFSYYNMGFGVLGKVIESITGKDYETYLREVLAKAGVHDIHVGKDYMGRRSNECVYYSQSGTNGYGNDMEVIKAAGGVIASTVEMMQTMLCMDGRPAVPDIISAETRTIMLTPSKATRRYALGWRCNHSYFPDSYYHSGNLAGTAAMWLMGGNGVNCVLLCNSRSYANLSGKGSFDDELYGLMKTVWNLASI